METIVRRYGDHLLIVFVLGAIAPMFFYETEFNKPFIFAFKYFSAPVLGACFYMSFTMMPNWNKEVGKFKATIWTIVVAGVLVLMSGGYVVGINALIGEQKKRVMEGVVSDLTTTTGSKGKSYQIIVENRKTHEIRKLHTTKKEFGKFKVGDSYTEIWQIGSLGILYKER